MRRLVLSGVTVGVAIALASPLLAEPRMVLVEKLSNTS
jgi:hypothetical protein